MADFFISEGAKRISPTSLQLTAGQDFKELKFRFRNPRQTEYIPAILPPRSPFGLILTYPIADLRSSAFR